uniref:MITF transcription factor n=1 Tax=Phallusia mammillata TaxID=59560 RepID=A0A6F9DK86_9ASCI|nr:MITF transcription factor [Phallusia mammillata]
MKLIDVTSACAEKRPAPDDLLSIASLPTAKQIKLESTPIVPAGTSICSSSSLLSIENDHCYLASSLPSQEKSSSTNDLCEIFPAGAQEELESDFEPLFDDWDSLPYDSDDDDGELFRSLMASPVGTTDNTSVHGSEGYGTDTSDTADTLNVASSKDSEVTSKPAQVVASPKLIKDSNKPFTPVFQAHSLIRTQATKTVASKCSPVLFLNKNLEKGKNAVTRVYHIPKPDPTQGNKVETQTRKTVLLRVVRPAKSASLLQQNRNNNNITMSRANLKMEMERARALQEEKQSQEIRVNKQLSAPKSSATSSINFPSISVSTPQLPSAILKVETRLENPTQYYVKETQRNQVRDYLSQSHDGTKYVVRQLLNPASSAPAGGDGHLGSTPASPMARLNLSTDSVNEIVDDIVSIESSMGDEHFRYDRTANTLPTISPNQLDTFALGASQNLGVVRKEQTSSSYPLVKRELTDDEIRHFTKDRIKKDNHNIIERRRRYNINDRIKELGHMVPKSLDPDVRWNKGSILKAAVDYIHSLKNEQARSRQVEQRAKQMENMNKKLLLRVQELEMMVQQSGIPVSSDQTDKQNMVQTLLTDSTSPTRDLNFTKEQELQVSSFPSNPVTPSSHSPILVTSPPGTSNDQVLVFQPGQHHHTPVGSSDQQQMGHNQLMVDGAFTELQQMNSVTSHQQHQHHHQQQQQQQQQQQHHHQQQQIQQQQQHQMLNISPVPTYPSHSPNPQDNLSLGNQQVLDPLTSNTVLSLGDMDISDLNFDPTGASDVSTLMGGSDFSAFLNENSQYSDVMMDDMIKDDIFLSDANNPNNLNQ